MADLPVQWKSPTVLTSAPPPPRKWLTANLMVLLSNFYQANEDDEIFQLRLAQWCEDLIIYPQQALELAFRDWRLQSTRRPTVKEIIDLTKSHIVRKAAAKKLERNFGIEPTITPERAAEIAAEVGGKSPTIDRMIKAIKREAAND